MDSQPVALLQALDYNDAKFASKIVFNNGVFRTMALAFRAGQSIPEHTTPTEACLQVLAGELEVTIGSDQFRVRAGEMLVLTKNIPHTVRAIADTKALLTK